MSQITDTMDRVEGRLDSLAQQMSDMAGSGGTYGGVRQNTYKLRDDDDTYRLSHEHRLGSAQSPIPQSPVKKPAQPYKLAQEHQEPTTRQWLPLMQETHQEPAPRPQMQQNQPSMLGQVGRGILQGAAPGIPQLWQNLQRQANSITGSGSGAEAIAERGQDRKDSLQDDAMIDALKDNTDELLNLRDEIRRLNDAMKKQSGHGNGDSGRSGGMGLSAILRVMGT